MRASAKALQARGITSPVIFYDNGARGSQTADTACWRRGRSRGRWRRLALMLSLSPAPNGGDPSMRRPTSSRRRSRSRARVSNPSSAGWRREGWALWRAAVCGSRPPRCERWTGRTSTTAPSRPTTARRACSERERGARGSERERDRGRERGVGGRESRPVWPLREPPWATGGGAPAPQPATAGGASHQAHEYAQAHPGHTHIPGTCA